MKKLLSLTAVGEALFGLILLVSPQIVVRLLLGSEVAGVGVWMSRFAGIAVIALATACWPHGNTLQAFLGMLTYGLLVILYLVYLGLSGEAGILLWPAVAAHALVSDLLVWAWRKEGQQTRDAAKVNKNYASF